MRKKIAVVALASGLGLTGGMLVSPSIAAAEGGSTSSSVGSRLTAIKDALKGLVADKTLTQAQADKVAATLDQQLPRRGPGGFGGRGPNAHLHPDVVAKVLGVTEAELRTQLQAGKTLAQIAQAKGMSRSDLVAGLVKAAEAELAQAVKDGRLTQAQADELKSTLTERITAKVDKVGFGRRGHRHGPPPPDAGGGSSAAPSSLAPA